LPNVKYVIAMDAIGIDLPAQIDSFFAKALDDTFKRDYLISFDCQFESLGAERGDVIRLNHILLSSYHRSGRITTVETDGGGNVVAIIIDQEIASDDTTNFNDVSVGGGFGVAITMDDGTVRTFPLVQPLGAPTNRLAFLTPATPTGIETELLAVVGKTALETQRLIIKDIEPTRGFEAHITCIPE
jgi:hypothetical protein